MMTKRNHSPDNATFLLNENAKGRAAEMMRTLSYILLPIGWVVVILWNACRCG
jgi:hypothetical protein